MWGKKGSYKGIFVLFKILKEMPLAFTTKIFVVDFFYKWLLKIRLRVLPSMPSLLKLFFYCHE